MILWRCQHRLKSLLIGDILISLILLWTLFYEQQSDKILLKIKFFLQNRIEEEGKDEHTKIKRTASLDKQFVIITSCQSLVFISQVTLATLSFIATLLSYKHKGIGEQGKDVRKLLLCFCRCMVLHIGTSVPSSTSYTSLFS